MSLTSSALSSFNVDSRDTLPYDDVGSMKDCEPGRIVTSLPRSGKLLSRHFVCKRNSLKDEWLFPLCRKLPTMKGENGGGFRGTFERRG